MPKGESSYFGFAKETTYGTETGPNTFWKVISCAMNWGRDMQRRFRIGGSPQSSEVLQRAWNQSGSIQMEADPEAMGVLLEGLFGTSTVTALPEKPVLGATTTLAVGATAGDTTITVSDATGFAVDDYIAIDTGSACEFAKITSISGDDLTIEASGASNGLLFDHDIGDSVEENETPAYKHIFDTTSALPSYTWELDLGSPDGVSAARFSGMTASSLTLGYEAMEPVMANVSFTGSKMSIHNTTATPTYDELGALYTRDTAIEFDGTDKTSIVKSMRVSITNGLEGAERTIESGVFATQGSAGGVAASFDAEALFDSDVDLQRFLGGSGTDYDVAQTTLPFGCTITTDGDYIGTSETNKYSLKLIMPNVYMTNCSVPVEVGRRIAQSWKAMAVFDDVEGHALQIELVNGTR
ncbi:MAG TPA: phage tail tube protein [Caldisericia bacterium]|nr:phage tail tube protein [Caldisericia bacterium]HPF48614.1 phage tail tube protein [Caldisericia bacterium]HPI83726.1 phage tail tube protein [Caldisericia bacterium]HPQ93069.1 phage tail tube protein [Caldisericia bacterium]HRV75098.1 phage tail tube protein [Caldisericia bacterium]